MNDTIQQTNTQMAGNDSSSLDLDTISFLERPELTLSLFGETTSTIPFQSKRGSNARSSATKVRSYLPSLCDRLTPSLITAGLVRGITPKSVRRRLGAEILDIVSLRLDGDDAE
jgi:hypothetical protein